MPKKHVAVRALAHPRSTKNLAMIWSSYTLVAFFYSCCAHLVKKSSYAGCAHGKYHDVRGPLTVLAASSAPVRGRIPRFHVISGGNAIDFRGSQMI